MEYYIKGNLLTFEYGIIKNAYLMIKDGIIDNITNNAPPTNSTVLDYSDKLVTPGLIDSHIHGYNGIDIENYNSESIQQLSKDLASRGITSWVPTIRTSNISEMENTMQFIINHKDKIKGARIIGGYFEGPFLSKDRVGSQNKKYIIDFEKDKLKRLIDFSRYMPIKICLAPENINDNIFNLISKMNNVILCLGHTNASELAYPKNYNSRLIITHIFNAMRGIHHRDIGIAGQALLDNNSYVEIIGDGKHLSDSMINLIFNFKSINRIILISDNNQLSGKADGVYNYNGKKISVRNNTLQQKEDNTLSGSGFSLLDSLKHLKSLDLLDIKDLFKIATINVAESLGLSDSIGSLHKGKKADILVFDSSFNLLNTYVNGVCVN